MVTQDRVSVQGHPQETETCQRDAQDHMGRYDLSLYGYLKRLVASGIPEQLLLSNQERQRLGCQRQENTYMGKEKVSG